MKQNNATELGYSINNIYYKNDPPELPRPQLWIFPGFPAGIKFFRQSDKNKHHSKIELRVVRKRSPERARKPSKQITLFLTKSVIDITPQKNTKSDTSVVGLLLLTYKPRNTFKRFFLFVSPSGKPLTLKNWPKQHKHMKTRISQLRTKRYLIRKKYQQSTSPATQRRYKHEKAKRSRFGDRGHQARNLSQQMDWEARSEEQTGKREKEKKSRGAVKKKRKSKDKKKRRSEEQKKGKRRSKEEKTIQTRAEKTTR